MIIIVPILAVGLWVTKYQLVWQDEDNHLKPWLFVYAASGIFQIIHYIFYVREILDQVDMGNEPEHRGFTS